MVNKRDKGITLIALVVTIVVLLIISGISLNIVSGDSNILKKAGETRKKVAEMNKKENNQLDRYADVIDVATTQETKKIKDIFGNEVKIPKGFKIATDSGKSVVEGIVIEDADNTRQTYGSQFVWVPVGTFYTNAEQKETETIILGRYVFKNDGTVDTNLSKLNPEDQLKTGLTAINYYTEDLRDAITDNAHAKDIEEFINSVNNNKGYYIARYEAGIEGSKNNYNLSIKTTTSGKVKPLSKAGLSLWNGITQPDAGNVSKCMYNTMTDRITSDLVNSYAWDTALLYIQKCGNNGGDSRSYSIQKGESAITMVKPQLTGENKLLYYPGGTTERTTPIFDTQCKIFDMAGNVREWTTEFSSSTLGPCVAKGDHYFESSFNASYRYSSQITEEYNYIGFRTILYF